MRSLCTDKGAFTPSSPLPSRASLTQILPRPGCDEPSLTVCPLFKDFFEDSSTAELHLEAGGGSNAGRVSRWWSSVTEHVCALDKEIKCV